MQALALKVTTKKQYGVAARVVYAWLGHGVTYLAYQVDHASWQQPRISVAPLQLLCVIRMHLLDCAALVHIRAILDGRQLVRRHVRCRLLDLRPRDASLHAAQKSEARTRNLTGLQAIVKCYDRSRHQRAEGARFDGTVVGCVELENSAFTDSSLTNPQLGCLGTMHAYW